MCGVRGHVVVGKLDKKKRRGKEKKENEKEEGGRKGDLGVFNRNIRKRKKLMVIVSRIEEPTLEVVIKVIFI